MDRRDYWTLFMETGAPEWYLLHKAMQTEGNHVFDDPGDRTQSYGLQ